MLELNLGTLVAYLGALLIALPHGLRAVCVAVVVVNVLTMVAAYGLLSRLGNVPLRRLLDDNTPAVVASAAMTAVALPLMTGLPKTGIPTLATLAAVGIAGGGAYLLALRILFRSALDQHVAGRRPRDFGQVAACDSIGDDGRRALTLARQHPWLAGARRRPAVHRFRGGICGRTPTTSPSKAAARLSAATPKKTAAVSVQTVSQLGNPAGLQVAPSRKPARPAKPRVTRPAAVTPVIAAVPAPHTTVATPAPTPRVNPTPTPVAPPPSTGTGTPQTGTGGQGSGSGGSTGNGTSTGNGGAGGTGTQKPTGTGVVSGGG